jgi:tRNA wybutosine-synthesizing protein 1
MPRYSRPLMLTQVVAFAKEVTALVADDYEIASEHAHSCAVMIGNKTKFKRGDDWYTWIDFPKFLTLFAESQKTGTSFSSLDYMARTPDWAIFGKGIPGDGGFNPAETHYRKGDSRSVSASSTPLSTRAGTPLRAD